MGNLHDLLPFALQALITSLRELVHEIGKGQGGTETSVPVIGEMPQCWKAAEGMVYSASPQAAWIHPPCLSMLGNGNKAIATKQICIS